MPASTFDEIAEAEQRRPQLRRARRRRHLGRHAFEAAELDAVAHARRRPTSMPKVTTLPGNRARAFHDARVVGVGDQHVRAVRAPRGSPPWRRRSRRASRRSRDARRRRWSTRGRPARRCRRACGSRRHGSSRARRRRSRGRARSSRSDRGRPIWLFRLPLFRNTSKRADRNSATTSLVVVLPALPVIATTLAPDRRRTSRARSCSARVVSSTSMSRAGIAIPASGDAGAWWTIAPMAPLRAASLHEPVPVEPIATESPRRSRLAAASRESMETRPIAVGGVAAARCGRRSRCATSVALKGNHSTLQHTRVPARRRSSADLATSTSSNGSTRSPITWYFS